jgi:prepilin-type N-terminal cleavage/methylation domain-containing protein/prepilin-type processing-associated H-X9-DG protein
MERNASCPGFTLIELLVVIAIIAILAAILFPVFAQARDRARAATCLSNIKQLSLGVGMYVQDYDETLLSYPGFGHCDFRYICSTTQQPRAPLDWWDIVLPYTKNNKIFDCPSAAAASTAVVENAPLAFWGIRNVAIGYNMSPSAGFSLVKNTAAGTGMAEVYPGVALAEVTRPADTILLGEAGHVYRPARPTFNSRDNPSPSLSWSPRIESGWEWGPEPRHSDGSNVGFVDGHARWMKPERFYGAIDVANKRIVLDCNGIWFRPNRDEKKTGDPPAPACGQ